MDLIKIKRSFYRNNKRVSGSGITRERTDPGPAVRTVYGTAVQITYLNTAEDSVLFDYVSMIIFKHRFDHTI